MEKDWMVLYEGWYSYIHIGDKGVRVPKKAMVGGGGKGPKIGTLDQCGLASSLAK